MNTKKETGVTVFTFIVFVCAFYVLGYWLIYRMGQATPLMMSVGTATIATCLVRKISLANLGWKWGNWHAQWQSYLIPFFVVLVAYLIIWSIGGGEFYNAEFLAEKKQSYNLENWSDLQIFILHLLIVASISFLAAFPSILGEELGWRGLLVPELSKITSFTGVALISGVIWSVFHWPLIFLGLYGNSETSLLFQLFFFTLFITSTGTIMAYFRLKTGSIWTAVIYHGASNIFIQKVFTPITVQNTNSSYYMDEFGIVLAVVAFTVAVFYWRKGCNEFSHGFEANAKLDK